MKARVIDYWQTKLRLKASLLPSLDYFKPEFMSLRFPHKVLTTAGAKSYEVAKARIQLLFLANQYPTNSNTRHWSVRNPLGFCTHPPCLEKRIVETREHILLECPAYVNTRHNQFLMCLETKNPVAHQIITRVFFSYSTRMLMQFLLDCSVMSDVISAVQKSGNLLLKDLFFLTRSWCFALHRQRMRRLGCWNFR